MMKEKFICQICKKETTLIGLATHIVRSHKNISLEEYYNKFINENDLCYCGEKLKFISLSQGYSKTCGNSKCIYRERINTMMKNYGVENVWELEETKNKAKETKKKKYGDENYNNRKQAKETSIEKYGKDNPAKNEKVKEKIKQTSLKKYGVDAHLKSKYIIKKRKDNLLETKGVENVFQLKETKEKSKHTKLERYNDENYNNQIKREKTNLEKYGSKHRQFTKEEKEKAELTKKKKILFRFFNSNRFKNKVTPLFDINSYNGVYENNLFKCNQCHEEFKDNMKSGKIPRCPTCYPIQTTGKSLAEKEIYFFLTDHIKNIEENKRFYENGKYKYELDIFLPDYNLGIEYNGIYYHSEISGNKDKFYHLNKSKYFENLKIQVIHIFEPEWLDNSDLVKSMLLSKISSNEIKIGARKCDIKFIDKKEVSDFITNNHIQGDCRSKINIGLYYNSKLVSTMTFGKSRFDKKYDYELLRYCNDLNTTIIGGFSRCLKFFEKHYIGSIISYANKRFSKGDIYLKNNFTKEKDTPPNYFYFNFKDRILENRMKYQKHKLKGLLTNFDEKLTEWQNMQLNNYDRIWDCGNIIFSKNTS